MWINLINAISEHLGWLLLIGFALYTLLMRWLCKYLSGSFDDE